jgi:micrococcal nuclease
MVAQASIATRRVASVVLVVLASCTLDPGPGVRVTDAPQSSDRDDRIEVAVVGVTDGDTIRVVLRGTETPVRLIGIDTPEREGPYSDDECFGEQASRYTTYALDGREVALEFDVERTDRFDRTLAYVWLGGALFNERILADGFATLLTFPPNVRYVDRFSAAQRRARDDGVGLWASCPS